MKRKRPAFKLPADRQSTLRDQQNLKMARSAHAYVRGNTTQFYEWLRRRGRAAIPAGPPVWICGDCHLGNLGPVANAAGEIDIQIRDLDQTVVGNPAHDLIRLALSLATGRQRWPRHQTRGDSRGDETGDEPDMEAPREGTH